MTFRGTSSAPDTPTVKAVLAIALSGAIVVAGCDRDGAQEPTAAAENSTFRDLVNPVDGSVVAASWTTSLVSSTATTGAQATTGRTATPHDHATATTRRTTTSKAPVRFRLTVNVTGVRPDASVLVSSQSPCSSSCCYRILEGRSITLTPNPRNHHTSWSGAGLDCKDGRV